MESVLVFETKTFAIELHSLLKELDPVRWKKSRKQNLKEKILHLENEVNRLYSEAQNRAHEFQIKVKKQSNTPAITEKLNNIRVLLAELKNFHFEGKVAKDYMYSLRKRMEFGYQELAITMEFYSVKLPSVRPTNYARSAFHILSALIALFFIEILPSPIYLIIAALVFSVSAWTMEILRRVNKDAKEKIMSFFLPVAHPHEYQKINSGTWYSTALVILALTQAPVFAAVSIVVLGFADPAAAAVGRKIGKTKLFGGRSLEGSLTFLIVGTLSAFLFLNYFHPMETIKVLNMAFAAALFGAIGELFGNYPDDNIIIPLSSALGAFLAFLIF